MLDCGCVDESVLWTSGCVYVLEGFVFFILIKLNIPCFGLYLFTTSDEESIADHGIQAVHSIKCNALDNVDRRLRATFTRTSKVDRLQIASTMLMIFHSPRLPPITAAAHRTLSTSSAQKKKHQLQPTIVPTLFPLPSAASTSTSPPLFEPLPHSSSPRKNKQALSSNPKIPVRQKIHRSIQKNSDAGN